MFCGNYDHDILHTDKKVTSRCLNFHSFIKEKIHFEETKGCSLEACTQVLVGTFVESLRTEALWTTGWQAEAIPHGWKSEEQTLASHCPKASETGIHDIDPLEWCGRQAHLMCERLLQDEESWYEKIPELESEERFQGWQPDIWQFDSSTEWYCSYFTVGSG